METTAAEEAAAMAAATAASWVSPASVAGLGPRFTAMGVLLPTVFLGVEAFPAGLVLGVLGPALTSFEGVGLLGVFLVSAALLLAAGFLGVESGLDAEADLGVSGLVVLAGEVRVRGAAAGFLVADLVTSFLMGVAVFEGCDVGVRPAEGVVEPALAEAGLGVVEVVLAVGVPGLAVVVELLAVLAVAGLAAAEAGRDPGAPAAGLVVLETGGLSGLGAAAVQGLVVAVGFLAAVLVAFTPLVGTAGVFFAAVPVVAFTPLVAAGAEVGRVVPVGFFSPTLVVVLVEGTTAVPTGLLGVVFSGAPVVVFLATPLVCGLETPLVSRLWAVLGRDPGPVVVLIVAVVPGFVLAAGALVLAFGSAAALLFPVLVGATWAGSG